MALERHLVYCKKENNAYCIANNLNDSGLNSIYLVNVSAGFIGAYFSQDILEKIKKSSWLLREKEDPIGRFIKKP
jgi:hypothetical protein